MVITRTQIKHITRYVQQWTSKFPVAVIGGYHGGNLGDMALGNSVRRFLLSQNIKCGLQTIYNLDKWPKAPFAILGGGAIGYTSSLRTVAQRYKENYHRVAIVGVDFNEYDYPNECINLIRNAAYVSCRSSTQANRLEIITGRKDIQHHPDIAFSILNEFCAQQREGQKKTGKKKLLVNVVPLYAVLKNGDVYPSQQYSTERPELYKEFSRMHASYKKIVRTIVNEALQSNYKVETIPFTPLDEAYAEMLLGDLPVKHTRYHSNPFKMLRRIAEADWVFATRLHTTIFALKTGVKLTPVAYATKNEILLRELGIKRGQFLSSVDLAKGIDKPLPPIKGENTLIKTWETNSAKAVEDCIASLNINFFS